MQFNVMRPLIRLILRSVDLTEIYIEIQSPSRRFSRKDSVWSASTVNRTQPQLPFWLRPGRRGNSRLNAHNVPGTENNPKAK